MTIRQTFQTLKAREETALIIYMTAGFPNMNDFSRNLALVAESGADVIEIGVPFSDPIADGPTIQHASQIALENGITLPTILKTVRNISVNVPLVMMSYLNPLLAYGSQRLMTDMKQAGISGLIIPDLPADESDDWLKITATSEQDLIFLVTPTSPDDRIRLITERSNGFVYCVSLTGTTGAREGLPEDLESFLKKVRSMTDKPVAVGFGISKAEHIVQLRSFADGVIVGSRVIDAIQKGENLADLIRNFKQATRKAL